MAKSQGVGHSERNRVPIIFVLPKIPSWVNYYRNILRSHHKSATCTIILNYDLLNFSSTQLHSERQKFHGVLTIPSAIWLIFIWIPLLSWSSASMSGFINCLINFVSIYAGPEPFLFAVLSPSLSQVDNNMLLLLLLLY